MNFTGQGSYNPKGFYDGAPTWHFQDDRPNVESLTAGSWRTLHTLFQAWADGVWTSSGTWARVRAAFGAGGWDAGLGKGGCRATDAAEKGFHRGWGGGLGAARLAKRPASACRGHERHNTPHARRRTYRQPFTPGAVIG